MTSYDYFTTIYLMTVISGTYVPAFGFQGFEKVKLKLGLLGLSRDPLHPGRLTWNIIMEAWKIIFLSKWLISRFHVNLPGCISMNCSSQGCPLQLNSTRFDKFVSFKWNRSWHIFPTMQLNRFRFQPYQVQEAQRLSSSCATLKGHLAEAKREVLSATCRAEQAEVPQGLVFGR